MPLVLTPAHRHALEALLPPGTIGTAADMGADLRIVAELRRAGLIEFYVPAPPSQRPGPALYQITAAGLAALGKTVDDF